MTANNVLHRSAKGGRENPVVLLQVWLRPPSCAGENYRYTYRITWSEEDQEYVGLCVEFPSLSWLADTPETAFTGIRTIVAESVEDVQNQGENIPEPIACRQYSGKFMVRVPPDVHRGLVLHAAEAGVSLNRLASVKLSH